MTMLNTYDFFYEYTNRSDLGVAAHRVHAKSLPEARLKFAQEVSVHVDILEIQISEDGKQEFWYQHEEPSAAV